MRHIALILCALCGSAAARPAVGLEGDMHDLDGTVSNGVTVEGGPAMGDDWWLIGRAGWVGGFEGALTARRYGCADFAVPCWGEAGMAIVGGRPAAVFGVGFEHGFGLGLRGFATRDSTGLEISMRAGFGAAWGTSREPTRRPWRRWTGMGLDLLAERQVRLTLEGDLGRRVGPIWLRGGLGWGVGIVRASGIASLPLPVAFGITFSLDAGAGVRALAMRQLVPEASLGVGFGFLDGYQWWMRVAMTFTPADVVPACRGACAPAPAIARGVLVEMRSAWTE